MARIRKASQKHYSHVLDWHEGGKRRRMFFTSLSAAQAEKRQLMARLGRIPSGEPGPTPDEFRAIIEARIADVPLMEAVTHYKRSVMAHGGRSFADLVDARIRALQSSPVSAHYRKCVETITNRARELIGKMPAAMVTVEDCQGVILSWKGYHSQKQARAILSGVFSNAISLGWLQFNPVLAFKKPRPPASGTPEIFTTTDAERWLACVTMKARPCFAGWAIAMFAGLRRREVERLQWNEVKLDRGHIEVTAGKAKTRTRRLVDIETNLFHMLTPIWAPEGKVFPHSPIRAERWARKEFGGAPAKNAARHSFVSYHLALYGDLAKTELQAGHGRDVLFQHYRELVTPDDAAAYFAIMI